MTLMMTSTKVVKTSVTTTDITIKLELLVSGKILSVSSIGMFLKYFY